MESHELGQPTLQKDNFSEEVISQILQKGVNHSKNNLARSDSNVIHHVIHVVLEDPVDDSLRAKLGPAVKPCQTCKDVIGDHYIVRKHSYVNPSANPYMCGICREAFDQGYLLKIHLEVEHGFVEQDSNRRSLRSRNRCSQDTIGSLSGSRRQGNARRRPSSTPVEEDTGSEAALKDPSKEEGRHGTRAKGLKLVDLDSVVQDKENKCQTSPDTTILLTNNGSSSFHDDDGSGGADGSDQEGSVEQSQKKEQCKNGDLIVINLITEGGSDTIPSKKSNRRSLPEVNEADRNRYKCDFCNLSFPNQQKRGIHIKQDHPDARLKCPVCKTEFSERRLLNVHLKTHKKEKPPRKLKPPKRVGPPLCTICNKTFLHQSGLQIHTQNFHPEMVTGEREFCCEQCGSMFWTKTAMVEHQKIHTGSKPFVCSYCKKAFCRKSDLKCHTKIHTGEKPHACTQCDKTFRKRLQLVNHLRVHTGEKPYKCDLCAYACKKRDQLTRHRRTHTEERPYKCGHCEKSFKTNGNLRDHVRLHTGDRPFKCAECDKAFAQYTNLVHHQRTHSGIKPFICTVCQRGFARSNNLKAHMKSHSGKRAKPLPSANGNLPVLSSTPALQQPAASVQQVGVQLQQGYLREQSGLQLPIQESQQQQHREHEQSAGSVIVNATEILASMQSVLQLDDVASKLVDVPVVSQQQQGLVANLCSSVDNLIPSVSTVMGGQVATPVNSMDSLPPNTGIPGYGGLDLQGLGQCESITVVGLLSNMSDFQNSGLGGF